MDNIADKTKELQVFYRLLSISVNNEKEHSEPLTERELFEANWDTVLKLASIQGVTAISLDSLQFLPEVQRPPHSILMPWLGRTIAIEKRMQRMQQTAFEYARELSEHDLKTFVLKGVGIAEYYPVPLHRECGDLDCFIVSAKDNLPAYEAGNIVSEKIGAHVERDYYKHSHIHFKGLTIENHHFCTAIRGNKKKKAFERHLEELLRKSKEHNVGDSHLMKPCADFTALFLTAHAMTHFLFEKIHFRHVLDWAFFIKAESSNINWIDFWNWCNDMHFSRFVICLNWICRHKLGMRINVPEPLDDFNIECLSEHILKDIFSSEHCMTSSMSHMKELFVKTHSFFKNSWKYSDIYQHSAFNVLLRMGWSYFIEREPKL